MLLEKEILYKCNFNVFNAQNKHTHKITLQLENKNDEKKNMKMKIINDKKNSCGSFLN